MVPPRSDIDLARFERPATSEAVPRPRGRWRRFLLPGAVLAGFLAVLAWSVGDVLRSRTPVTVVRPRAGGAALPASGGVAFQAAGWVEPDPFPMHVTPLTAGTVAEVLVQESDAVKRGDPVARLIAEDVALELEAATAEVARAEAELARARIDHAAARKDFDAAIALTERVETARAGVAGKVAERDLLREAEREASATVRVAEQELAIQGHLRDEGAAGPRQVELADAALAAARAALARASAAAAHADAQLDVARAQERAALRDQELRIEDRRRVDAAREAEAAAAATVRAAQASLAQVELRKARTVVRSPWDGVVLERLTIPGATVGGEGLEHTAICSLYDPAKLRVRVDVPQADIVHVFTGQSASIVAESRRGQPYSGTVARIVQRADIQKVTLQIHVRVADPDGLLRPEMLCQVRFTAKVPDEADAAAGATTALLVPARLVDDGAIWVLDAHERSARRRVVQLGARRGDEVEVLSGINVSDKLLDAGGNELHDGALVRIREVP